MTQINFDYQTCTFEARLWHSGLVSRKEFYLYVSQNFIIVNDTPYAKVPSIKIPLQPSTKVHWLWTKSSTGRLRSGFRISSGNYSGEFQGEPIVIQSLKKTFTRFVIQSQFSDEYKLLQFIDKGNYAAVHLCRSLLNDAQFAVKVMDKSKIHNIKKGRESVFNQMKVLRGLDHPNLLKLVEVFQDRNKYFFVMEWLQGKSLHKQVSSRIKAKDDLKGCQIRHLLRQILQGVDYMAKHNILHRDLKPENMIFRGEGGVSDSPLVIADYGLATYQQEPDVIFTKCGTPGYVAPEIIFYKDGTPLYGTIVDMFSVGVVLHVLLLNQPPFPGRSRNTILDKNKNMKIDFTDQKYDVLSRDTLDLLKGLIQGDPSKRLTAQEALTHQFFTEEKPVYKFKKRPLQGQELDNSYNRNFVNLDQPADSPQLELQGAGLDHSPMDYECSALSAEPKYIFRKRLSFYPAPPTRPVKNSIFLPPLLKIQ